MFYQFFFHCRFTSTETVRNIRNGEPRTATSTLTHTLSSVCLGSEESVFELWFVFKWVGVQSGINKAQTHQFKHILRYLMKISVLFNILYVFTSSGKSLVLSHFKRPQFVLLNRDLLKLRRAICFPCCFKRPRCRIENPPQSRDVSVGDYWCSNMNDVTGLNIGSHFFPFLGGGAGGSVLLRFLLMWIIIWEDIEILMTEHIVSYMET